MGTRWMATYLGAEMGLYFLIKIARDDFEYWIPESYFLVSLLLNTLLRFVMKAVTDFTSIVPFRHPFEMGGVYWLSTFL